MPPVSMRPSAINAPASHPHVPRVVLVYGLAGLLPFLPPPLAGAAVPAMKPLAALVLTLYGGLILSFVGGARWGLAIAGPPPRPWTVCLAMIPNLAALGLLLLPSSDRSWQCAGLAAALALHWAWDLRGGDLPAWYSRLRTPLTLGAVTGLTASAVVLA